MIKCSAKVSKSRKYWVVTASPSHSCNSHEVLVSGIGNSTEKSRYEARRRAFRNACACVYCNQEKLSHFVTLTYKKQHNDGKMISNDLKNVFSRNKISYIGCVEKHKKGGYHIHLLTSDISDHLISHRPGKNSLRLWTKGFSDVKYVSETNDKFRIELYIFKYLAKSEKLLGKYFVKSRDLTVNSYSYAEGVMPTPLIHNWDIDRRELSCYNDGINSITIERLYYENPD